jgi:hypothetical protein
MSSADGIERVSTDEKPRLPSMLNSARCGNGDDGLIHIVLKQIRPRTRLPSLPSDITDARALGGAERPVRVTGSPVARSRA